MAAQELRVPGDPAKPLLIVHNKVCAIAWVRMQDRHVHTRPHGPVPYTWETRSRRALCMCSQFEGQYRGTCALGSKSRLM